MAEDAQLVHEVLHKLVDQGKDVIVIGHSYGGVPMTEGTKGLSKEERKRQGKSGGVVRLGYMTAFAPLVGRSLVTSAPPAEGADDRTTLGEVCLISPVFLAQTQQILINTFTGRLPSRQCQKPRTHLHERCPARGSRETSFPVPTAFCSQFYRRGDICWIQRHSGFVLAV